MAGVYTNIHIDQNYAPLNFCPPPPFNLTVLPKPTPVNFIKRVEGANTFTSTEACIGVVYTYEASSDIPGTTYRWSIAASGSTGAGTIQGPATGKQVSVIFTSLPAKLKVERITTTDDPVCSSNGLETVITPFVLNFNVTPISQTSPVCPNTTQYYSATVPGNNLATYTEGETYEWIIDPPSAGSVVSGNNTPQAAVLWNNTTNAGAAANVELRVRKCNMKVLKFLPVQISGAPPAMRLTLNNNTNICPNESSIITLSTISNSIFSAANIVWDFGDGTGTITGPVGGNNSYPITHAYNIARSAIPLKVTVNKINGCSGSNIVIANPLPSVSVKPVPVPVLNYGGALCIANGPYTLTVSNTNITGPAITSYSWYKDGGLVATSPSYVASTLGKYEVVVTNNANNCLVTSNSVTIKNCDAPCNTIINATLGITATANNCGNFMITGTYNSSAILNGQSWSGSSSYTGQTDTHSSGSGTSVITAVPSTAGYQNFVYTVTFKGNGSELCRKSTNISVLVPVVPSVLSNVTCTGSGYQVMLTYQPNGNIVTPSRYDFYIDGVMKQSGPAIAYTGPVAAGMVHTYGIGLQYTYGGTVYTCSTTVAGSLPYLPLPPVGDFAMDVNTPATPISCAGVAVHFTHSGAANPGLTYNWDFGDGTGSLVEYPGRVYEFKPSNQFPNITLTTTNTFGCTASITKPLNIVQNTLNGRVTPLSATICSGLVVPLNYQATSGSTPITTGYQWYDGIVKIVTGGNIATYTAGSSGYYWLHGEDANKCYINTLAVPVSVIQLARPVITTPGNPVCISHPYDLDAFVGASPATTYAWTINGTPPNTTTTGPVLQGIIWPQGAYTYQVTASVATIGGPVCSSTSAPYIVTVSPPPATPFVNAPTRSDVVSCNPYTIQLDVVSPVGGTGYTWSNNNTGPSIQVHSGGPYTVTYTQPGSGCASTPFTIYVPNDPQGYLWTFPDGCYNKNCIPEPGGIHIDGPVFPFDFWAWVYNGNQVSGSGPVPPLVIHAPGTYSLVLDNGLCSANSSDLQISSPGTCLPDIDCPKLETIVNEPKIEALDDCGGINIPFDIINSGSVGVGFSLSCTQGANTQFGTFTILSPAPPPYQYALPGTTSVIAQWLPPVGYNHQSVTFYIHFTTLAGCDKELYVFYEPCKGVRPAFAKANPNLNPSLKDGLSLAPNPAQNSTMITYLFENEKHAKRAIEVYDATGRKVYETVITGNKGKRNFNTANQPAGLYNVVLKENGAVYKMEKLIINR